LSCWTRVVGITVATAFEIKATTTTKPAVAAAATRGAACTELQIDLQDPASSYNVVRRHTSLNNA